MRMQTDVTLDHLQTLTSELGKLLRQFHDTTCEQTETYELPRETAARQRRREDATAKSSASLAPKQQPSGRKKKTVNLNTYKFHALGDYVQTIKKFGPTTIYSTQKVNIPPDPAF